MLSLSYTTEHKGEMLTLKLKKNPMKHGTGWYEDTDGVEWDINCIMSDSEGRPYVNARRISANNSYYSTASGASQDGHHEWIAYYYEVQP